MNVAPSPPFSVPFTFCEPGPSAVQSALLNSEPSRLCAAPNDSGGCVVRSLAIGCKNGDLFLLSQRPSTNVLALSPAPSLHVESPPSSPRPPSRHSYSISRSGSPSSISQAPFHVSSRSRIVSGLSRESVEAPKNYVDFDDEPGKLKDMLKGKPTTSKDRDVSDTSSISSSAGPQPKDSPPRRRREDTRSLLSATNTPTMNLKAPLPSSVNPQPPPIAIPSVNTTSELNLFCHVVSPESGGGGITGLQAVDDVFIALLNNGQLAAFSSQDGRCLFKTHVQDSAVRPPAGLFDHKQLANADWTYNRLESLVVGEFTLLFALARLETESSSRAAEAGVPSSGDWTRVSVYEYRRPRIDGLLNAHAKLVGDWHVNSAIENIWIGLPSEANTFSLFYIQDESSELICQNLLISAKPLELPSQQAHEASAHHGHHALTMPFKIMGGKGEEAHHAHDDPRPLGKVTLVEEVATRVAFPPMERIFGLSIFVSKDSSMNGAVWSSSGFLSFRYTPSERKGSIVCSSIVRRIRKVQQLASTTVVVLLKDRLEQYEMVIPDSQQEISGAHYCHTLKFTTRLEGTSNFLQSPRCFSLQLASSSAHLDVVHLGEEKTSTLWRSIESNVEGVRRSVMLPLDLDHILLGCGDGKLRKSSFASLIGSPVPSSKPAISSQSLNGYIISLHNIENPRTKEEYVVGGADDGSIAFWSAKTCDLKARWVVFNTLLSTVLKCSAAEERFGPLRGCILCVATDGAVAVIVVDGFQYLYLIPGSSAALVSVSIQADDLLLLYADNCARLWDLRTQEFRRSLSHAKYRELLAQGDWISIPTAGVPQSHHLSTLGSAYLPQYGSTFVVDLQNFIADGVRTAKGISTNKDHTRHILSVRSHLKLMLSSLHTFHHNAEVDTICRQSLKLTDCSSSVAVGTTSMEHFSLYDSTYNSPWCISGNASAARLLAIILTLRALYLFEDLSDHCAALISYYANTRSLIDSPLYQPPSIVYLASRWFGTSAEVRSATKVLVDGIISRLTDEEATLVIEQWQQALPCVQQSDARRDSSTAALALFLCGYVAVDRYASISPNSLTDISKSIDMYLHDEKSRHRVLAVDLTSSGFHIWQHYVDAMGMLRSLFSIGTSARKENISTHNAPAQARLAILQIAANNTPLFITTVSLDILSNVSVEHRKAVLQILAFMIRKRPMILLPSLPRLLEAVVKSLDPNSTGNRDAVLETATEILGHVVEMFPSVDFHMSTQKLAVGTSEGATVMYDLKSATRLYVLEGHKERVTGCSFSPDGRRLVTASSSEGMALVWKVGSSFASFFYPGAPPRQGHDGSAPFKTFPFIVPDEESAVAESLESIHFEWPTERSVRLRIRESTLTFST